MGKNFLKGYYEFHLRAAYARKAAINSLLFMPTQILPYLWLAALGWEQLVISDGFYSLNSCGIRNYRSYKY